MLQVSCPVCNTVLNAPPSAQGKRVRCRDCETVFRLPADEIITPPLASVPLTLPLTTLFIPTQTDQAARHVHTPRRTLRNRQVVTLATIGLGITAAIGIAILVAVHQRDEPIATSDLDAAMEAAGFPRKSASSGHFDSRTIDPDLLAFFSGPTAPYGQLHPGDNPDPAEPPPEPLWSLQLSPYLVDRDTSDGDIVFGKTISLCFSLAPDMRPSARAESASSLIVLPFSIEPFGQSKHFVVLDPKNAPEDAETSKAAKEVLNSDPRSPNIYISEGPCTFLGVRLSLERSSLDPVVDVRDNYKYWEDNLCDAGLSVICAFRRPTRKHLRAARLYQLEQAKQRLWDVNAFLVNQDSNDRHGIRTLTTDSYSPGETIACELVAAMAVTRKGVVLASLQSESFRGKIVLPTTYSRLGEVAGPRLAFPSSDIVTKEQIEEGYVKDIVKWRSAHLELKIKKLTEEEKMAELIDKRNPYWEVNRILVELIKRNASKEDLNYKVIYFDNCASGAGVSPAAALADVNQTLAELQQKGVSPIFVHQIVTESYLQRRALKQVLQDSTPSR